MELAPRNPTLNIQDLLQKKRSLYLFDTAPQSYRIQGQALHLGTQILLTGREEKRAVPLKVFQNETTDFLVALIFDQLRTNLYPFFWSHKRI